MYDNFIYRNIKSCVNIKLVNLIEEMNRVWLEHVFWTRLLIISIIFELDNLIETQERLLQNPKDISKIFEIYYGRNIAMVIERLLTEHLVIGKELIVALKNNEKEKVQNLSKKWYQNAEEMAKSFSEINPYYNKDMVLKILNEHLRLTTDEVLKCLHKNYGEDIKAYDKVQYEALTMSKYFVEGLNKQFRF